MKEGKEESNKEEVKEDPAKTKRKPATATGIQRSDSTGSQSGRTLLAPTLSDPQARHEKDRFPNKKKTQKHQINAQTNAATKLEVNRFVMPANHQNNSIFEVHDWWHEQVTYTNSSDEE